MREQVDCLVCDKVTDELLLGLCELCYINLHICWDAAAVLVKEKNPETAFDSMMEAYFGASIFGRPALTKKRPLHEIDDIEGVANE